MEEILKQNSNKSSSHKEFEKLLSEDLNNRKLKEGEIITVVVSSIGSKHIFIDISAKSEGVIPIEEFKLTKEIDKIKVGSKIEVLLEKIENIQQADFIDGTCQVPTHFIRGENSNYITIDDENLIREHFSDHSIVTIENAGHWVHSENPEGFY